MRPDRDMRVVVEILSVAIAVVRLQHGQLAARAQLLAQPGEHRGQIGLGDMLEQIAGEGVVDRSIGDRREVGDGRHDRFDAGRQLFGEIGPDVERDAAARFDIVDTC